MDTKLKEEREGNIQLIDYYFIEREYLMLGQKKLFISLESVLKLLFDMQILRFSKYLDLAKTRHSFEYRTNKS